MTGITNTMKQYYCDPCDQRHNLLVKLTHDYCHLTV